ncbi:MAG TPA: hypothetical protein VEA80_11245 [Vitreimonas sp.]|uniref:hypothetical protein n=1 Tax=Vitreimonas sp. TaxID=3069702 RepID=UPI002D43D0B6|nr:hypothetical protein [Vitreimonas sp.]HYD88042.1 hypothetical protein [Vitreimonas sp.]
MKLSHFALTAAALALAACGQQTADTEAPAAPAAPQGLMEQVQAMAPENQLVFATTQLAAYQQAHPESQPPCQAVRGTESRGVIPPNIDPNSAYGPYVGSLVISVQCGELRTATRMDPNQQWLVVFAPGATEVQVANCGGEERSRCPRTLPLVEIGPTPTP